MAGKKITQIDAYGSQDNEKALKDLYECVKNSGTYATPVYATGDSRKIDLEQLISIINANIDTSFVKLFVGKSNGDTIELDKVNSLSLSSDATFTLPTSTSANNGSIIIIRHQGGYNATITGYSGDDIILKSFNDILFFASVFDGTNYFWQLISESIKGIKSLNGLSSPNQIFSVGTSGTAPNFSSSGAIHTFNLPYSGTTGVTMGGLSKTDYDALFAKQDALGYTPENSANKTDTVAGNESSTSKYLSVKGYYDYLIGLTWLTNSIFGTFISGLTAKTTPTDADTTVISDSADSNKAKKLTFSNLKAFFKSYFDTQYPSGSGTSSGTNTGDEFAFETWSSDSNYTTVNTSAKWLFVFQTGTLTSNRTITITNSSITGQNVAIIASNSVSSSNKIIVAVGFKINVILSAIDIVNPNSQTWLTSTSTTGNWITNQATPQFSESQYALTATKYVRSVSSGIGLYNTTSLLAAAFPTGVIEGDIIYNRKNLIMSRNSVGLPNYHHGYVPYAGWQNYRPTTLQYWNETNIQSGNKPLESVSMLGLPNYWNKYYRVELYGESSNAYSEYIILINGSGIPSIIKTVQENTYIMTASGSPVTLNISGGNCYAQIYYLGNSNGTNTLSHLLNDSFSTDGSTRYWSGSLGIGHQSQNASAIVQFDSTTKVFAPPRMTTTQRLAISSPMQGGVVYDTTLDLLCSFTTGSNIEANWKKYAVSSLTGTYTPNTSIGGTTRTTVTVTVTGATVDMPVVANINDAMRADFVTAGSWFLDMQAYVSATDTVTISYIVSTYTTFGATSSINISVN